ncbi:GntR family transcriptional regulator [Gemmiger gallinarum]|uniref:GntR family transcriptional regulator n=1 Tax=Gemmiger gallinarum TaxID=2779354 RepID=UPI001F3684E3|nr:GntR family transcriptional regulator [Gemmiger gallinarum]
MKGILNDQNLIYQQIAQMLEDGILRGEYPEESQVPSTNELARAFNINPATAAKGINRLVDEGLLYKRRGIGMFVAEGALKTLQTRRRKAFAGEQVRALVREAMRLGMSREELLQLVGDVSQEEGLK